MPATGRHMSSPAGLQFSQADFLARWMPNSSRAGVILGPCTVASSAEGPNDSFGSDFAPLPASADSSCLAVGGCPRPPEGDTAGSDGPLNGQSSDGELESLDPMESPKQAPAVRMKLDQVRPACMGDCSPQLAIINSVEQLSSSVKSSNVVCS